MEKQLKIGYSPYGSPSESFRGSKFYPFDDLFDFGVDLTIHNRVDDLDAVLLWGGEDISPSLYNEEPISGATGPRYPSDRDLFEWEILRQAYKHKVPIIGVCRGAQLACAFAGGKLIQHVNGHGGGYHTVDTYDSKKFSTTSAHHQMMYPYDVKHELLAWSTDHRSLSYFPADRLYSAELEKRAVKEPEVVFFPEILALAIQGHPEWHDQGHAFNNWFEEQIIDKLFNKVVA